YCSPHIPSTHSFPTRRSSDLIAEPGTDRLFVVQQGGETNRPSRILDLRDDPGSGSVETFLVVSNYLVYSFTFHPGYRANGYVYRSEEHTSELQSRFDLVCRLL